jgi:hypothetical protein
VRRSFLKPRIVTVDRLICNYLNPKRRRTILESLSKMVGLVFIMKKYC